VLGAAAAVAVGRRRHRPAQAQSPAATHPGEQQPAEPLPLTG